MKRRPHHRTRYVVTAGSVLAAGLLLVDLHHVLLPKPSKNLCQEVIQSQSVLSRTKLAQLIDVPERSNKSAVRAIVSEPYCRLASVQVREGVTAEREAYPLAFDPKTWVVVLYEGDEYAGYDFTFQR